MKKLMIAASLLVLVAASAVAAPGDMFVSPNATFAAGSPATTNMNDTCDIGVFPAATLLLPVFEVEVNETRNTARTTLFTLVNTTAYPQIAHIIVWTDWSFPVLDFNIFLTGYDVQGINLYDIIVSGPNGVPEIPPTQYSDAAIGPTRVGPRSAFTNPDFLGSVAADCNAPGLLPGPIPADIAAAVRSALTTGVYTFPAGSPVTTSCTAAQRVGGNHPDVAMGYVTIDVARTCSQSLGIDATYYTQEIAFDNALTGDWIITNPDPAAQFAGGNPLVHIRAIPGGVIGANDPQIVATNLPFTFYDRYVTAIGQPRIDRRQPLPGTFAARYIDDANSGFDTDFLIWREGTAATTCAAVSANARIALTETVRFDEAENPTTRGVVSVPISPVIGVDLPFLPEASITDAQDFGVFPPMFATRTNDNGWIYMNLNNGGSNQYSAARNPEPASHQDRSQNWVSVRMEAVNPGQYSVLFDATMLTNGCSADPGVTSTTRPPAATNPIGPGPVVTPLGP